MHFFLSLSYVTCCQSSTMCRGECDEWLLGWMRVFHFSVLTGSLSLLFYLKMSVLGALVRKLKSSANQPCKWHPKSASSPGCSSATSVCTHIFWIPDSSLPLSLSLAFPSPGALHQHHFLREPDTFCLCFYLEHFFCSSLSSSFIQLFIHSLNTSWAPIMYQTLL